MKSETLKIPGLMLLEPRIHKDERGYFFESFNSRDMKNILGEDCHFVQDNHSCSHQGVLRGLHYQLAPKAQGKLVRVIRGKIFDVAVDIRKDSPYFGQWESVVLSAENKKQLWIPPGFAHGFLSLDDDTEVLYKTTEYYAPELERTLLWNDPTIGIEWPSLPKLQISEKDAKGQHFVIPLQRHPAT